MEHKARVITFLISHWLELVAELQSQASIRLRARTQLLILQVCITYFVFQ